MQSSNHFSFAYIFVFVFVFIYLFFSIVIFFFTQFFSFAVPFLFFCNLTFDVSLISITVQLEFTALASAANGRELLGNDNAINKTGIDQRDL